MSHGGPTAPLVPPVPQVSLVVSPVVPLVAPSALPEPPAVSDVGQALF